MKSKLTVTPLGGYGEIGKNMTVMENNKSMIIIDAGISFPSSYFPGVEYIIPDISYVTERKSNLKGIFITHGHEDHIGALPYIIEELGYPTIYTKKLARELIKKKFDEHGIEYNKFVLVDGKEPVNAGDFSVQFIHVNHSIPDSSALFIESGNKRIYFSGDFKIDYTPVNEDLIDLKQISKIGEKGVDLMIVDSTNIETPGMTGSETAVGFEMEKIVQNVKGRIFVATFASNISRLIQILDIAKKYNRKVVVEGRSLKNIIEIAGRLGFIKVKKGEILNIKEADKTPDEQLLVLVTGSQGEPMSVLQRLSLNMHPKLKLKKGDTVMISAKMIPGNEIHINKMVNQLFKSGARVYYKNVSEIHVSGHAAREDIKMIAAMVNPKAIVPFHGEYKNMAMLKHVFTEMGYKEEQIILAEIGTPVYLAGKKAYAGNHKVPSGKRFVENYDEITADEELITQRKIIGQEGVLFLIYDYMTETGDITMGPEVASAGLLLNEDHITEIGQRLQDILYSMDEKERKNREYVKEAVSRRMKRFLKKKRSKEPVVISHFPEWGHE